MDDRERLQFVRWLIDREDKLRASTATRGAIVLSANALVFGGLALLLKHFIDHGMPPRPVFELMAVTVICLLGSAVCALSTSATLLRPSGTIAGLKDEARTLVNARATVAGFDGDFVRFRDSMREATDEKLLLQSLGELWVIRHLYRTRYAYLRWAMRLFLLGLILLLVVGLMVIQ